jgi:DHA3 family macrolide efflux protein-like MFS transporter|tara:strand:- start:14446 stop:15675 length:1230 start_codon:yes stop_codon:yes gene_type:complete
MLKILFNKTFLLFFLGNIISLIGFGLNLIAFSWLVLEETGSEFALGKIMAAATTPGLILALFAGVIIDKVNRKWLLVILDIFRVFVITIFIYNYKLYGFNLLTLYPVMMLMGLGNSLFWPTAQAFVQELVDEKDYFPANALLSASYQVGSLIGAGAGGFIVHIYGPIAALYFNAAAYFISAIFIGLAPFKNDKPRENSENISTALSKGFLFLKDKAGVLFLGLTTIMSDIAIWGALSVLTITISKEIFNKGSWGYGLMDGMYGVGALISTVAVAIITKRFGRKKSLTACYSIAGLCCFISPFAPTIYVAGIAYLIMGLHNNSARIIVRTLFMEIIPNNIMGRVQTIFGVYTRIMMLASVLIAGWITENLDTYVGMNFASAHYFVALAGIVIISNYSNFKKEIFNNKNNA